MGVNFIIFALFVAVAAAVPIAVGVYVYRDAKQRNMNAALWTLIAVLAPSLMGLIIYLIVRVDSALCPSCKVPVTESYLVCPNCGAALQDRCPSCGFRAEPDWKVCPQCTAALPTEGRISGLSYKKDSGIGKILAAVILVPVLLFGMVAVGAFIFSSRSAAFNSMAGTTTDIWKENYADSTVVQSWFTECESRPDGAYVLIGSGYEDGTVEYLVYLKGYEMTGLGTSTNGGGIVGKPYMIAQISAQTNETEYGLFFIETRSTPPMGIKLKLNGKDLDYEGTDVRYPLAPGSTRQEEKEAQIDQSSSIRYGTFSGIKHRGVIPIPAPKPVLYNFGG